MKGWFWVGVLLLAGLLTGCRPNSLSEPEGTVAVFIEAWRHGNKDILQKTLTNKAQEQRKASSLKLEKDDSKQPYEIAPATITGETASVPVKFTQDGKEDRVTFRLRREEGQWRIATMRDDTVEVLLDFEDPQGPAAQFLKPLGRFLVESMGNPLKETGKGQKSPTPERKIN